MAVYADGGGPFPQRLPVIALSAKFFAEFAELLGRWAEWAEDQVATWEGTGPGKAEVPAAAWERGLPRGSS